MLLMTVTMKQVSVTSLLLILGIACSATAMSCQPGDFRCYLHGFPNCIPGVWLCDSYNDCDNGTDEDPELCQVVMTRDCPENFTKCEGPSPSVWCVFHTAICDGNNNCGNNWDEDPTMCAERSCRPDWFKCPNNRCIPENLICDGFDSCGDLSDEQNCDIMRKSTACMEKDIIEGTTPGKRKRGQPRTSWIDNITIWTELHQHFV